MDNLIRLVQELSAQFPGVETADLRRHLRQAEQDLAGSVSPPALPEALSRLARLRLSSELLDGDLEFATVLCSATSLVTVAHAMRAVVQPRLHCAGVTFVLVDGDQCFYPDDDPTAPVWAGQRMPIAENLCGWAILTSQPAVINNLELDERVPAQIERPGSVRSLVMVPVLGLRGPLGAVGAYWITTQQAGRADLNWLRRLAQAAGSAISAIGLDQAPWAPNFRTSALHRQLAPQSGMPSLTTLPTVRARRAQALARASELAHACASTAAAIAMTMEAVAETRRALALRMARPGSWQANATKAERWAQQERDRAIRLRQAAARVGTRQPAA